jgi:glutathione S-transferase
LDLSAGEHKEKEFLKINPRSCVPTIVDDDFVLWESKAILMYLPHKLGMCKARTYPKCPKMRALVHQRLLYDSVDFYPRVTDVTNLAYTSEPIITAQHKANLLKALSVMEESFLEGHDYFVGDHVTIADFAFCSSIATLMAVGFDMGNFPKIQAWFERMRGLKGFDQLEAGAGQYGDFVKSRLKNSFEDF